MKRFTPAGIALHLHADLSHADGVYKYTKNRVSSLGQWVNSAGNNSVSLV